MHICSITLIYLILTANILAKILSVPFCKLSQSFPQTCIRLEAKVLLQGCGVGVGDGDISRLHRDEFLVRLKIVVFG